MKKLLSAIETVMRIIRILFPMIVIVFCILGLGNAVNLSHGFWLIILIILGGVSLLSMGVSQLLDFINRGNCYEQEEF